MTGHTQSAGLMGEVTRDSPQNVVQVRENRVSALFPTESWKVERSRVRTYSALGSHAPWGGKSVIRSRNGDQIRAGVEVVVVGTVLEMVVTARVASGEGVDETSMGSVKVIEIGVESGMPTELLVGLRDGRIGVGGSTSRVVNEITAGVGSGVPLVLVAVVATVRV